MRCWRGDAMSSRLQGTLPWMYNESMSKFVGVRNPDGTDFLWNRIPYAASFQDLSNQPPLGANQATPMECDTTDFAVGVTMVDNSKITFSRDGYYNIQFSAQFQNTSTSNEYNISVWLQNGVGNIANSCTDLTIPKKHGGGDGLIVAAWNFFVPVTAGSHIQIMWSTAGTSVSIAYLGTRSSPDRPAVPSVILTVNEVDGTPV